MSSVPSAARSAPRPSARPARPRSARLRHATDDLARSPVGRRQSRRQPRSSIAALVDLRDRLRSRSIAAPTRRVVGCHAPPPPCHRLSRRCCRHGRRCRRVCRRRSRWRASVQSVRRASVSRRGGARSSPRNATRSRVDGACASTIGMWPQRGYVTSLRVRELADEAMAEPQRRDLIVLAPQQQHGPRERSQRVVQCRRSDGRARPRAQPRRCPGSIELGFDAIDAGLRDPALVVIGEAARDPRCAPCRTARTAARRAPASRPSERSSEPDRRRRTPRTARRAGCAAAARPPSPARPTSPTSGRRSRRP